MLLPSTDSAWVPFDITAVQFNGHSLFDALFGRNALLEFARVLKSKEQVVAEKAYYLTLEEVDAGKRKLYEAKVWVKPWMDFKKLELRTSLPSLHPTLGARQGIHKLGWHIVPNHDPEVQDAANYDVKDPATEVIESSVRFQLLLKLKRGMKIESLTFL